LGSRDLADSGPELGFVTKLDRTGYCDGIEVDLPIFAGTAARKLAAAIAIAVNFRIVISFSAATSSSGGLA